MGQLSECQAREEAIIDLAKLKKSLTAAVLEQPCIRAGLWPGGEHWVGITILCKHRPMQSCVCVCSRVVQSNDIFGRKSSNVTAFEKHASSEEKRRVAPDDVNGALASWPLS